MTFGEILPGLKAEKYVRTGWGGAETMSNCLIPSSKMEWFPEVTPYFSLTCLVKAKAFPCGVQLLVMSHDRLRKYMTKRVLIMREH